MVELEGIKVPRGTKLDANQLKIKKVYQYSAYNYWFIEPHRNIITSVENLAVIKDQLKNDDKRSILLFYKVAALFAVALLQAGRDVISKNVSDVGNFARQYIFGGTLALK
jgi:hypothetical protein